MEPTLAGGTEDTTHHLADDGLVVDQQHRVPGLGGLGRDMVSHLSGRPGAELDNLWLAVAPGKKAAPGDRHGVTEMLLLSTGSPYLILFARIDCSGECP